MINNKNYITAFSLLELLLVVAIIAAMFLIAQPYWQNMVSKNHAQAYANELMMTLQFTRASAIKSGKSIKFCGSQHRKECDGIWGKHSSIVVTKDKILRVLPPVFAGDTLGWTRGTTVTFSPDGFAGGHNMSFYYCPKNFPENALAVILSPSGRARISPKTHDGKRIPCNF